MMFFKSAIARALKLLSELRLSDPGTPFDPMAGVREPRPRHPPGRSPTVALREPDDDVLVEAVAPSRGGRSHRA